MHRALLYTSTLVNHQPSFRSIKICTVQYLVGVPSVILKTDFLYMIIMPRFCADVRLSDRCEVRPAVVDVGGACLPACLPIPSALLPCTPALPCCPADILFDSLYVVTPPQLPPKLSLLPTKSSSSSSSSLLLFNIHKSRHRDTCCSLALPHS